MKKNLIRFSLTLLASALLIVSCAQPFAKNSSSNPSTLSEVLANIVIPDEALYQSSGARSVVNRENLSYTGAQDNPSPYLEWLMSTESRGSIFLYLLKYDFSKMDEIVNGNLEEGITIQWGQRKVSDETATFVRNTQGDMVLNWLSYDANNSSQYLGFGELKFSGTLDDIVCMQKQNGFNHYITMKKNASGFYNISFYAYENFGPQMGGANVYFENTKTNGTSSFEVDYWEVKDPSTLNSNSVIESASLKNPRKLKFSNKELKKYAYYNENYICYSYGNYSKKTAIVKEGNNFDFGFINSNNVCEVLHRVVANSTGQVQKNFYNLLWVSPKSGTLTRPSQDQHPGMGQNLDFSKADSTNCSWKLDGADLVNQEGLNVYIKGDIRNAYSYYEKAYFVDFTEQKTSELFTVDDTSLMDVLDLQAKVIYVASDPENTNVPPSTMDYDTITAAVRKVIPVSN